MSEDKSTASYYLSERNQAWLEERPESASTYLDDLITAARTTEWNGQNVADEVELRTLQAEINALESEYEAKQELLEDIKTLKSETSATDSYEDQLVTLLESIEDEGTHIWPEHNRIDELAIQQKKPPEEVIKDAKHIAADRDMDILTTQFVRAGEARYMEGELIGEAYDDE